MSEFQCKAASPAYLLPVLGASYTQAASSLRRRALFHSEFESSFRKPVLSLCIYMGIAIFMAAPPRTRVTPELLAITNKITADFWEAK